MQTRTSRQAPTFPPKAQTIVGAGVLLVAAGLAFGALQIPSDSGYGGVGPNFLPWVCAVVLGICGVLLIWEAQTGGFAMRPTPAVAPRPTSCPLSGFLRACW